MPRKSSQANDQSNEKNISQTSEMQQDNNEVDNLSRMLASVLDYLSDDSNEVIDIEYIFDQTEGLREWWREYRESNRKLIEAEIKESLGQLSLEELQKIREQIKDKDLN